MSSTSPSTTSPIPLARLSELANEICASVFPTSTYNHALTPQQNSAIINTLLQKLISESSSGQGYKFMVTSTIIQQVVGGEEEVGGEGSGKRGMHCASGAYWNNERDGMWSFKWEGKEGRGFDVVVCVVWVSVV